MHCSSLLSTLSSANDDEFEKTVSSVSSRSDDQIKPTSLFSLLAPFSRDSVHETESVKPASTSLHSSEAPTRSLNEEIKEIEHSATSFLLDNDENEIKQIKRATKPAPSSSSEIRRLSTSVCPSTSDDDMEKNVRTSPDSFAELLLPEILSNIFEYLPVADRNSVRLTSKLWNECCCTVPITKGEKHVFRKNHPIDEAVTKALVNPRFGRKRNLEFHGLVMNWFPTNIWEECGKRVKTLYFYNSFLSSDVLYSIILHCVNLTSITIHATHEPAELSTLTSLAALDHFVENRIQRFHLLSFEMFFKYSLGSSIHVDVLSKIFTIFPNIKHLGTNCLNDVDLEYAVSIEATTRLESLAFTKSAFFFKKLIVPQSELRLTNFETEFDNNLSELGQNTLLEFFTAQKDLKTISLKMTYDERSDFLKQLIVRVLETCANLRLLCFECTSQIHLTLSEVSRFVSLISKLRYLKLSCAFWTDSFPIASLPSETFAVRALSLSVRYYEKLYSYLLKRCSKVKHLELVCPWDGSLQDVFETMPALETLILREAYRCTVDGFTGHNERGFSINRLRKLKHLELHVYNPKLTGNIAREVRLPHLKQLIFGCPLPHADLCEVLSNAPTLEVLKIIDHELNDWNEVTELSQYLRNLHILEIRSMRAFTLKILFETCPNLKYVITERCVFWCDASTKTISESLRCQFHFANMTTFDRYFHSF